VLGVERVDHGIHSLDDPKLVEHLERTRIALTLCPQSNLRLKVRLKVQGGSRCQSEGL
jgi:adenosine deaminase